MFSLGGIIYQDFAERRVWWFWFPLLALAGLGYGWITLSLGTYLEFVCINFGFLILQAVLLLCYLFVSRKRVFNPLNQLIGLGDVLFFTALTFWFHPMYYILFYIGSLLFSLMAWIVWLLVVKNHNPMLPLAGLAAVFYLCILGMVLFKVREFTNTEVVIHLFESSFNHTTFK